MANQNLSQFTEKLFVADADHTFIWDSAASISKRVSRNSWLSGTTADFHLGLADAATAVAQTISVQSVVAGTSNTAGANLSINGSQGTGTGAGGSLLLRTAPAGSSGTAQNALVTAVAITSAGNVGIGTASPSSKLHVAETWNNAGTSFCAIKSVITDTNSAAGSDFLELYSGTSTQPLRFDVQKTGQMNIYGAWTDTSNYERLSFSAPSAANAVIGTNKAGTGTARGLEFQTDGVTRMTIAATGEISTGNNRIGVTPGGIVNNGGALGIYFGYIGSNPGFTIASAQIIMTAPIFKFNVMDNTGPALKRSSTTLQVRLGDDLAFAPIQGKLTTDTAYTATVVTPTGFITLYDSTGTAYKVPCVPA